MKCLLLIPAALLALAYGWYRIAMHEHGKPPRRAE